MWQQSHTSNSNITTSAPNDITSFNGSQHTAALISIFDDDVGTITTAMHPLSPSIPFATHLALTATATVIFSLMFVFIYVQLWMILYYRHKKRSYQTIFLFLCLVWAALRLTLFTFYFKKSTIATANALQPLMYWFLYSLPVVLQFTTLVLLVAFFSQVSYRGKDREYI